MSVEMDTPAASPRLLATRCAICGTKSGAEEMYPATLELSALTPALFSARRLPDRVHHRIVRCRRCRLVRSDPVLDPGAMAELYRASSFDYGQELEGLRSTYGAALDRVAALVPAQGELLDIGCGSGFVLSLALDRGWESVRGVEPSADAIDHAPREIAAVIEHDLMRPGLFAAASFDAVTLFQVLDHMPDPLALLRESYRILKPGGVILAFNHNVSACSARVLRERSPIIDVEHTYLYSPPTMTALFEAAGFLVDHAEPVNNTCSAGYLLHLLPIPSALKRAILPRFRRSRLGRVQCTLPLGNLCLLARRPE
jgi:SAM-dependent methyltransferase